MTTSEEIEHLTECIRTAVNLMRELDARLKALEIRADGEDTLRMEQAERR